jgi:hypothetical protein
MNKFEEIESAMEIILDGFNLIRVLEEKNNLLQRYFSRHKVRNIHLRRTNISKHFKAVVCSKFEIKSEISGLALVLYKDSSGKHSSLTILLKYPKGFLNASK